MVSILRDTTPCLALKLRNKCVLAFDYTIMNRATFIEQLKQTHELLAKLLALLEAGRLTSSPRISTRHADNTGCVSERPKKGNKAIEREVISSYQIAQSLGFNGDFRAWEHCCGFMNNIAAQNMQNRVKSDHLLAEH